MVWVVWGAWVWAGLGFGGLGVRGVWGLGGLGFGVQGLGFGGFADSHTPSKILLTPLSSAVPAEAKRCSKAAQCALALGRREYRMTYSG